MARELDQGVALVGVWARGTLETESIVANNSADYNGFVKIGSVSPYMKMCYIRVFIGHISSISATQRCIFAATTRVTMSS